MSARCCSPTEKLLSRLFHAVGLCGPAPPDPDADASGPRSPPYCPSSWLCPFESQWQGPRARAGSGCPELARQCGYGVPETADLRREGLQQPQSCQGSIRLRPACAPVSPAWLQGCGSAPPAQCAFSLSGSRLPPASGPRPLLPPPGNLPGPAGWLLSLVPCHSTNVWASSSVLSPLPAQGI